MSRKTLHTVLYGLVMQHIKIRKLASARAAT